MENIDIKLSPAFADPLGGGALNRHLILDLQGLKPFKKARFCTLKGGAKC